jgi:hypothetical protein
MAEFETGAVSNLDLLYSADPALAAGVARLAVAARGRHVFGGWAFGNFMDDEPAERMSIQPDSEVNPGSAERGSG